MHRVLESHEIQRCALRMIMHTTLNILVYLLDLMNQTPFIEIHILSAKWNWKNPAVICSWLLPKRLGFFFLSIFSFMLLIFPSITNSLSYCARDKSAKLPL